MLGKFIATMFLHTYHNNDYHQLYRGMMAYLTEKYQNVYNILSSKVPSKSQQEGDQQQLIRQQKANLASFRFRPRRLLQNVLLELEQHFDPLTCSLSPPELNGQQSDSYETELDCRQLLVDVLRHLFAPIDESKFIKNNRYKSKTKSEDKKDKLSSYTDEQLLSAYFPMIEDILRESVKDHPNLILLASSQLSIPIKPALFTKMIHSLVFNGNVDTLKAISPIIDEYYNSNAANPYIEYFQYEPDNIGGINDDNNEIDTNKSVKPEKPWLISSKTEWTFLPYQMIDSQELERIGMKISDLILFDGLLYDKRLDDALKHLSLLHKEKKISYIIIKQIVQRTLNYMEQRNELRINDKEYVRKVTDTLSKVLNQIPVTNNASNMEIKSKTKRSMERKQKDLQETNELFECIWNESGFIRGAIVLQGLLIKLDDKHCLKPHLQKFCINEFSKLTQYGLLEPETDEQSTMLLSDKTFLDK